MCIYMYAGFWECLCTRVKVHVYLVAYFAQPVGVRDQELAFSMLVSQACRLTLLGRLWQYLSLPPNRQDVTQGLFYNGGVGTGISRQGLTPTVTYAGHQLI